MPIDSVSNNSSIPTPDKNFPGGNSREKVEKKPKENSEEQLREIRKLSQTDRDVRSHEAAHMAAGGQYVKGGATFQYQKGPDGKMYAVGGEVSIDTSPVKGNPQATISKMQAIKSAALAPADPSGQDRSVAAQASAVEAQARQELTKKSMTGTENGKESNGVGPSKKETSSNSNSVKISSYNNKGEATPYPKNNHTATINLISIG
jgi:hypothetical protein